MNFKKTLFSLFLFCGLCSMHLFAQNTQFHINPGFLLSQVDGDSYGGFKKIGYSLGAGFRFDSDQKSFWDWSTRVNQKGFREVNAFNFDGVRLNYLETELVYGAHLDPKFDIGFGAYYGILLNLERTLRRSDIAPVFRGTYRASEKIDFSARFSWSARSIRERQYSGWLNRALLFEMSFDL